MKVGDRVRVEGMQGSLFLGLEGEEGEILRILPKIESSKQYNIVVFFPTISVHDKKNPVCFHETELVVLKTYNIQYNYEDRR